MKKNTYNPLKMLRFSVSEFDGKIGFKWRTQKALARIMGTTQSTLAKMERDKAVPSLFHIRNILLAKNMKNKPLFKQKQIFAIIEHYGKIKVANSGAKQGVKR